MAGRSFTRDVLQALAEIDDAFVQVDFLDSTQLYAALSKLWRVVGGLEGVALRRASAEETDWYHQEVLRPRATRRAEGMVELMPAPRADKDGVPW